MQNRLDFPLSGHYDQQSGPLKKDQPPVLEYRLWIRRGREATARYYANEWDALN